MMNSESELTVKRPGSFIGLSMAEIRGVYVELNPSQTHIPRGAYVCTRKYLTRFSYFKSRVSTAIKSHVSATIKSRVPMVIESRIFTIIESHFSTSVKFTSPLDRCAKIASMRAVFSNIQGVCLCFCNQFNNTLTKATDNSTCLIVHRQINQSS